MGLIASTSIPVKAQGGGVFDLSTTAKRYNFSFVGQGRDNAMAAVGWFEANSLGTIVDARAEGWIENDLPGFVFESLSPGEWKISVKGATNGIYELDFLVGDINGTNARFIGTLLLEDAHGRRGKIAGRYSYRTIAPFARQGSGTLTGEIAAK